MRRRNERKNLKPPEIAVCSLFSTVKNLIAHKIAKISAYIFGVALLIIGVISLGIQIELGGASPDYFSSCLFAVVFVICGAFTCFATWAQLRGGIITVLGFDFVGFGLIGIASIAESHLQGSHTIFTKAFYFRVIAFCIIGCICLAFGLVWPRNNKQKNLRQFSSRRLIP